MHRKTTSPIAEMNLWLAALLASFTCGVPAGGQPTEAQAKAGSISGRVVDAGGVPLAGTHVWLHKYDDKTRLLGPAISKSTVDSSGQYRFAGLADASYIIAAEGDGLATSRFNTILQDAQNQKFDISLRAPVEAFAKFRDESGRPIQGVTLRQVFCQDDNGKLRIWSDCWQALGLSPKPSDREGRLSLPALPEKTLILEAAFDRIGYAPVKIKDVQVAPGEIATVTMKQGVTITLNVAPASDGKRITDARLMLLRDDDNPSEICNYRIPIIDGLAKLTIEPGKYRAVRLERDGYFISPQFANDLEPLEIGPERNDTFRLMPLAKVKVSGRVLSAGDNQPIKGAWVQAEVPNQPFSEWMYVGAEDVDANGRFALDAPAGHIHLTAAADHYLMDKLWIEAEVGQNGSVLPDIKLRPTPTITGRVVDSDGRPVAGAILRFRGYFQFHRHPPATTDQGGQFQFQVEKVPHDFGSATGELAWRSPLDVCDPTRPLSTRVELDLSKPETISNLTIVLHPESYADFLHRARQPTTDWEKKLEAERREYLATRKSAAGQPAPPLDGAAWYNTDKRQTSLPDFHGKYVLLDFWTVWCGPCHADFPDVKLLSETYKDRGLVVIGVHDNSVDADSVGQHARQQGLTFPIVVDRRDGAILDAYKKIGAVSGFPSYVLIGPDGKIVETDLLAMYKFEYIRKHLFGTSPSPENNRD
jgi:thiol-disulfide isomerase/thioredoxin